MREDRHSEPRSHTTPLGGASHVRVRTAPSLEAAETLPAGRRDTGSASAGDIIGHHYRLVRPIAQGSIGDVWLAEHVVLKTEVAIKFLRFTPEAGNDALGRFRFESQVSALLSRATDNLVAVFDAGESDLGPYLVMEHVPGGTLLDVLGDEGPLSPERFLEILDPIAGALAAAHAGGIVHRDVKPANILVARARSGALTAKITDFGIAKAIRHKLHVDFPKPSGEHAMLGTPAYMAPEQFRGGELLTAQVDLWALGVVSYHALTGRLPFNGKNFRALMTDVLRSEPPPPSTVRPGLPKALDAWMARALCKDPKGRFTDALDLLAAYHRALAGVATAPAARPARAKRHTGDGKMLLLFLAVCLTASAIIWAALAGSAPAEPAADPPSTLSSP